MQSPLEGAAIASRRTQEEVTLETLFWRNHLVSGHAFARSPSLGADPDFTDPDRHRGNRHHRDFAAKNVHRSHDHDLGTRPRATENNRRYVDSRDRNGCDDDRCNSSSRHRGDDDVCHSGYLDPRADDDCSDVRRTRTGRAWLQLGASRTPWTPRSVRIGRSRDDANVAVCVRLDS